MVSTSLCIELQYSFHNFNFKSSSFVRSTLNRFYLLDWIKVKKKLCKIIKCWTRSRHNMLHSAENKKNNAKRPWVYDAHSRPETRLWRRFVASSNVKTLIPWLVTASERFSWRSATEIFDNVHEFISSGRQISIAIITENVEKNMGCDSWGIAYSEAVS